MKKILKKIKSKILSKLISRENILSIINPQTILDEINKNKIDNYLKNITIGSNSKIYEQCEIHNLMGDKNKIRIGENSHIRGKLLIFANGGEIIVGNNCYVGESTYIWSADKISIGNDVLISDNVHIVDTNSHEINAVERAKGFIKMLDEGHPKKKGNILTKSIEICDNAWISFNVTILKGVTIGRGAIVGAGSVVTKDVPEFCLVAGNPAKIIKKLNND
jgi:acetyltransferase-like isoleucine patch superfamily enzyme